MGLRDELHSAVSRRDELSVDARTLVCQKVELEKIFVVSKLLNFPELNWSKQIKISVT